jgi:hypothetical protein
MVSYIIQIGFLSIVFKDVTFALPPAITNKTCHLYFYI